MRITNPLLYTRARGLTNTTLGMSDGQAVTMGAYTNFLPVGTEAILT